MQPGLLLALISDRLVIVRQRDRADGLDIAAEFGAQIGRDLLRRGSFTASVSALSVIVGLARARDDDAQSSELGMALSTISRPAGNSRQDDPIFVPGNVGIAGITGRKYDLAGEVRKPAGAETLNIFESTVTWADLVAVFINFCR